VTHTAPFQDGDVVTTNNDVLCDYGMSQIFGFLKSREAKRNQTVGKNFKGGVMQIEIKKGQILTSSIQLSKKLKISISTSRRKLIKLAALGKIQIEPMNHYTLVTIL
jgi:DNA-binding transcriptional MocR family regulator